LREHNKTQSGETSFGTNLQLRKESTRPFFYWLWAPRSWTATGIPGGKRELGTDLFFDSEDLRRRVDKAPPGDPSFETDEVKIDDKGEKGKL